jgi:hypothetical protein
MRNQIYGARLVELHNFMTCGIDLLMSAEWVGGAGQRGKEVWRVEGGCETRSTLSPSSAFLLGVAFKGCGRAGWLAGWQVGCAHNCRWLRSDRRAHTGCAAGDGDVAPS